ncbi:MAG: nitrous oxide reductase family maturation protein NosD [Candidatus Accumulibacter sp.]|uniref:nitrous oxide reductase family maturation protein NosD n=1 Tax=Accumulibacter sp. TaxID=2053492 RepID=UPI0019F45210|nr:nitrous oxide reductase family maturation protein NosD [Accumulibacter sp.]MBE2258843.1 nitrous oxide reductase family maturation protein NosD [Paracoccaceae bacterium]MCP5248581.1 nitrous oxide reductase family maturation protein NosD [Accumulibacter sp.]
MAGRLLAAGLACGLALVVLPSPGGAEDALTALRRTGTLGSGAPAVAESGDSRLGEMSAPKAAGWGGIGEQAAIPSEPRVAGLPFLQELINAAPAGSVLQLKPGRYAGPAVVNKTLTIDGGGEVTVDGGGKGTVFVLEASDAVLRGVHLTNSGVSHDSDDACLNVRGDRNVVENLRIDDCLFGIDLKLSNDNTVRGNHIRSKPFDLGTRGDSLRLWYSHRNLIADNTIEDSRDMVAWYSNENHYLNNVARRSRYSIHFMFAADNLVEGNRFYDNAVGVNVMYSGGGAIRNNLFSHANGPTGMAVGFKEASNVLVEGNEIIYCAVGVGLDMSPFEPDSTITIRGNRIAYNSVGVSFLSDKQGTIVEDNVFEGNLSQVAMGDSGSARRNVWRGNYWDDYQGFDRNGDNVGDRPHELYAYTDQVWMDVPYARFFRNAPMMEMLDFLERLAPFSTPVMLLRDEQPVFHKSQETSKRSVQ